MLVEEVEMELEVLEVLVDDVLVEVVVMEVEVDVELVEVLEVLVDEVEVEVVEVEVLEVEVDVVPVSKFNNSPTESLYTLPTTPAEAFNRECCWMALMVSSIPLESNRSSPEPSL